MYVVELRFRPILYSGFQSSRQRTTSLLTLGWLPIPTSPTRSRSRVATCRIKLSPLRVRTQNAIMLLAILRRDTDGNCVRRRAILNPGSKLVKEGGGLSAHPAPAVAQPRYLEMAVKLLHVRHGAGNPVVVGLCASGCDDVVPLKSSVSHVFTQQMDLEMLSEPTRP